MNTFSIQLILAYICLSNAKLYAENDGNLQRQWPWNQYIWSNQNGWTNGTTGMRGKSPKYFYLFQFNSMAP